MAVAKGHLGTRAPLTHAARTEPALVARFRVAHTLTDSRRFRMLAVVDDFTRECLALVRRYLAFRRSGRSRTGRSDRPAWQAPSRLSVDNGTEFTSMAILGWSQETQIGWHYIAPGKPHSECFHRELQRATAGRTAERDLVRFPRSCPRGVGRTGRKTTTPSGRTAPSATCRLPSTPN